MIEEFPIILKELIGSERYSFREITKSQIHNLFEDKGPTPGIYLISDSKNRHLYVGRSKTLAQRVGKDHRSLGRNAANLTFRISIEKNVTHKEARDYMYGEYFVQMIKMENEHMRTVFEVFAAMELKTPYNSFLEH